MNDNNEMVKIGSLEYTSSQVLKNVDEVAYNCGLNDYNDERIGELAEAIEAKEAEIAQEEGEKSI